MKCDGCGQQFSTQEAVQQTRNEPIGERKNYVQEMRIVLVTLCPACAASRHRTFWFLFWTILAAGVIAGLIALAFGST